MRYISVCSGIEAATQAWHPLGWTPLAFSEIEPFPCKVLAHHYPDVPNLGDMTKFKEWPNYADVDVLVGGTPCQSFSVAGLRKGLDDPRGNLMLTYLAIAAKYRPGWLVWENVPGVLSSNGGRDFGTFLTGLAQFGYGFAYRVLDAQYVRTDGYPYAVPQRRRRVFVVGCLGDWGRAAAVLFDSESLLGNPPPRRESGQGIANAATQRTFPCGGIGSYMSGDVSSPLLKTGADLGNGCETIIMSHGQANAEISVGFSPTLNCNHEQPIALVGNTIGRQPHNGGNRTGFDASGTMYTLTKTDVHAVAFSVKDDGRGAGYISPTICNQSTGIGIAQNMQVRRLTPRECERLQAFPDDYTNIPGASDTTRYKALGNSMAVNVMQLIGERIAMVNAI